MLRVFNGFASETLPWQPLRSLIKENLVNEKRILTSINHIRGSHATAKKYSSYAFGKWLHFPERIDTLLNGKIYEIQPERAELVISLLCNMHCPFCTYADLKERTAEEKGKLLMDFNLIKYVLDEFYHAGISAVIWTGGGEPTTHPNLLDGMLYSKKLGMKNGLFTNGSLLTEEMIKKLLFEIAPNFIRISINGPTQASHGIMHGLISNQGHVFSDILRNLETLAALKFNHKDIQTTIGIGVLVSPFNADSLFEYARLLKQTILSGSHQRGQVDYIVFRPQVIYGGMEKKQHPREVFIKARDHFNGRIMPEVSQLNHLLEKPLKAFFIEERFEDIHASQQKECSFCLANSWGVSILPDGRLHVCPETNGKEDYFLGDLSQQAFEKIWTGEQRKNVLHNLNHGLFKNSCPPICVFTYMNKDFASIPFPLSEAGKEIYRQEFKILRGEQTPPDVNFL